MAKRKSHEGELESLRVRPKTKRHYERVAAENRLPLADTADVVIEAWDQLTPEQQMKIIRRPATEPVPA